MPELLHYAVLSFTSLFVIVDPVGLIPAFLVMTHSNTVRERVVMSAIAASLAFAILLFFALTGLRLFHVFGITLAAFEIAGGIVLLLIGIDMLQAKRTPVRETPAEEKEAADKADIAATPLAVPMLAGPGAITMVVLLSTQAASVSQKFILSVNILLVAVITFGVLALVSYHAKKISIIALKIMARLMGLLLTAVAVQFMLQGLARAGVLHNLPGIV